MTKNNIATKDDIKRLETKFSSKFNKLEEKISESELKILTELKDMREESDAHQFSHIRINDELQEHGGRLKKLETAKI